MGRKIVNTGEDAIMWHGWKLMVLCVILAIGYGHLIMIILRRRHGLYYRLTALFFILLASLFTAPGYQPPQSSGGISYDGFVKHSMFQFSLAGFTLLLGCILCSVLKKPSSSIAAAHSPVITDSTRATAVAAQEPVDADFAVKSMGNEGNHEVQKGKDGK
jgi:hypothetical protein